MDYFIVNNKKIPQSIDWKSYKIIPQIVSDCILYRFYLLKCVSHHVLRKFVFIYFAYNLTHWHINNKLSAFREIQQDVSSQSRIRRDFMGSTPPLKYIIQQK